MTVILMLPVVMSCGSATKEKNKNEVIRPNIIMILADDQGWGDLSINGNQNLSTPNIDRISENGATFDRFYVCAVCSPTRAEMLTGRYHPRGGVYSTSTGGERLDLDETTIAEVFKRAGYSTAAFGKWHNGMQYPYHPNARGFDEFYGFCSGHWGNYFSPLLEHNGELIRGNGYVTDDFTDHAIAFIKEHKASPFFVYLPFNTPHAPMQVPDEWWEKFERADLAMRHRDPEKEDVQFTRAALAMCENIDWNVGRVINTVRDLELEENTIILYFSDNGPNGWRWNGGMKGKKGSTDEGGVRSPLSMQWKGVIEPGKKVTRITGAIDLLPTLADLAGIACVTNNPIDGISLRPLLINEPGRGNTENKNNDFGEDPQWDERLIFNHWGKSTSVRSQQYRLDGENRLYDMENDPGQITDVGAQYQEVRDRLIAAKNEWRATVLSELPTEDNRPVPVGHPDCRLTQLPARDAVAYGNIRRSARPPNCSFFKGWTNPDDKISWNIEVLTEGEYEVVVYYTCAAENVGSVVDLTFRNHSLRAKILEPHDPPLLGMEHDRVKRNESYVKDFKPFLMGTIHLEKGTGELFLTAPQVAGSEVMDFRLMRLRRI